MPLIDPDDIELHTLRALARFTGQRVLEVGAGDGRLAWPFAAEAALWLAADTDRAELAAAAADLRDHPLPAVRLLATDGQALALPPDSFDIAFFTWSLCCVPRAGMSAALVEASRVLRPHGQLLDIHPTADPPRLEAWLALRPNVARQAPNPADYRRVPLGALTADDTLDDFQAATAAVDGASQHFDLHSRVIFDYPYFFDDLDALTDYLDSNEQMEQASDALLERAFLALSAATTPAWLVLIQPVVATSLRKR